jgi:hypothetical protein
VYEADMNDKMDERIEELIEAYEKIRYESEMGNHAINIYI